MTRGKKVEFRPLAEGEHVQLASLRERYPELAEKVEAGELTLAGARAESKERDRQEEEIGCPLTSAICDASRLNRMFANDGFMESGKRHMQDADYQAVLENALKQYGAEVDAETIMIGAMNLVELLELRGSSNG